MSCQSLASRTGILCLLNTILWKVWTQSLSHIITHLTGKSKAHCRAKITMILLKKRANWPRLFSFLYASISFLRKPDVGALQQNNFMWLHIDESERTSITNLFFQPLFQSFVTFITLSHYTIWHLQHSPESLSAEANILWIQIKTGLFCSALFQAQAYVWGL